MRLVLQFVTTYEASDADAGESVVSVSCLNETFAMLDDVKGIMQDVLGRWEPPRVVVVGNQSNGRFERWLRRLVS